MDEAESAITELQRKKELEEANYRYYSASLEQARINGALGAEKISNINVVQSPSPPVRDYSQLIKLMAKLLAGGVIGGIGLAFFIELFLDQSIKRPIEVETKLRLPLFLSIPDTSWNGRWWFPKLGRNGALRPAAQLHGAIQTSDSGVKNGKAEVAPWDSRHSLRTFYEALRDRLVAHFEIKNMTHKPKLVAVASCSKGAGVTTIAAGLAASLSETGDGNVLLVDMGLERGAVHPFHKGRPGCPLPDVLENEKRAAGLVQEHLYLASANEAADKLPRILPSRFTHLVPKMKASDYDYIIFDMPPVSQTSVTARLAGFMDLVFLVVESEKTDREVLKRATSLLAESNANVTAILNKNRAYVPPWLHQEL
jgi:Mrp family chromosome partitioning ATPase